jgi:hypothetical protein
MQPAAMPRVRAAAAPNRSAPFIKTYGDFHLMIRCRHAAACNSLRSRVDALPPFAALRQRRCTSASQLTRPFTARRSVCRHARRHTAQSNRVAQTVRAQPTANGTRQRYSSITTNAGSVASAVAEVVVCWQQR